MLETATILDQIGGTPLVEIRHLNPNPKVKLLAKLEGFNPGGSVKDRIAKSMIESAEQSGELTPGKIVLEPTSGNTGIGLALVCAVKGYRLMLTMSESASMERRQILSALGAEILLTPGHLGTDGAIEEAYRLARENTEKYFLPDQFNNPANMEAHYHGTGPEIWEQTNGLIDVFVATMGTTGTLMGVSKRLKELNSDIKIIGAEPYLGHKIQGLKNLKEAYVPGIYDRTRLDDLIYIDDEDAYDMARRLAAREGIFVGMSSGAAMHVAIETAREMESGVLVVLLPDGGERYLSTNLFIRREKAEIKFYNILSRTKEPLEPIRSGYIGMYSCGPALHSAKQVATYRHIVVADLLKRYLRYRGFEVRQVMSLVDIDDRTISASAESNQDLKEFTEHYFQKFLTDCRTLGIEEADEYPRAGDHVEDMVNLASSLVDKGAAYEKLRSLYFDISSFSQYGKLSGVDPTKIRIGKTVDLDVYEKENPKDFTLFKRSTLAELKRGLYYNTDWGSVRPGWHIECAVMSTKYLGDQYDIHTGGIDLNFPHHENVNAICETAYGKPMSRYWLHSELVLVDGQKMSRSLGNAPTIPELIEQGHSGRAIRFWLLSTHYRKPLAFGHDHLRAAAKTLARLDEFVARLKHAVPGEGDPEVEQNLYDLRQAFNNYMDDDLNVAGVLSVLFKSIRRLNPLLDDKKLSRENLDEIEELLTQLNLVLNIMEFGRTDLDQENQRLLKKREEARREGNYSEADRLRDMLKDRGITVIDTASGTRWQQK